VDELDYIVIGGGSAGCIVAARLAQESDARVLLLELGDHGEDNPETLIVDGYKDAFINDRVMWPKFTTPQPGCFNKSLYVGSGRGLGGSGAINAMVYLRSSVSDFDDWRVPSWRWSEVVSEYEALERTLDPHRREPTGFTEACIAAAEHAGFRRAHDLNDGDLDNVLGYEWMNYRGDERRSSYVAFLRPALERTNLRVETGAQVRRVLFDANRKVEGVEYVQRGVVRRALAKREVVLTAGAVETAKLMLLSGIGAAPQLRKHGIATVLDQPRVGQNFQDHPNVTMFYQGAREMDAKYPQLYGFARANPRSDLRRNQPDTCYVFYPARSSLREMMMRMLPAMLVPPAVRERSPLPEQGIRNAVALAFQSQQLRNFVAKLYGTVVILGKPKSRGTIELASAKVSDPAKVDPAYFSDPEDLQTMVEGVKLARRITGAPALREWGARELFPGRWAATPKLIEGFIRANAMTTFHFAGTCSMGTDERSVVDERLRVRGIEGLRIADASVMPVVPVSALNAPSMLIGHRAASFMLADAGA
jgi:choline dehydrogenase